MIGYAGGWLFGRVLRSKLIIDLSLLRVMSCFLGKTSDACGTNKSSTLSLGSFICENFNNSRKHEKM